MRLKISQHLTWVCVSVLPSLVRTAALPNPDVSVDRNLWIPPGAISSSPPQTSEDVQSGNHKVDSRSTWHTARQTIDPGLRVRHAFPEDIKPDAVFSSPYNINHDLPLVISSPGIPGNVTGNWTTNKCSLTLTGNTGYTNAQMWSEADADGAWAYVASLNYDGSLPWSRFVAQKLNLSSWQSYSCQTLTDYRYCMYQQDCTPTITPGAWMVINSLSNLWGFHYDIYNLVQTAHAQVNIDLVVNNFSPQFDTGAWLEHQIFLTDVTFGLMLALGAVFSIGAEFLVAGIQVAASAAEAVTIKTVTDQLIKTGVAPDTAAVRAKELAVDETNAKMKEAALTAGIMYTHDIIASVSMYTILNARYEDGIAETGLAAQNVLTDLTSNITNRWQATEADFIVQLFNGSQSSIESLGASIANGTWLTPWNETNSNNNFTSQALPLIEKHLYGSMIPYAWAAATKSKNQYLPVIIMADGCISSITNLNGNPALFPMLYDKGVDDMKVCVDGRTFWLLTPYKTGSSGGVGASGMLLGSDQVRFQMPPGLNMLNGQNFGGLTVKDIVISSYYAWTNNSFINPTQKPNISTVFGQGVWAQGVQYPGFFNYPICHGLSGIAAAAQSFWDKSYTVPC